MSINCVTFGAALHILSSQGVNSRNPSGETALIVQHENSRAVNTEMTTLAMISSLAYAEPVFTSSLFTTVKVFTVPSPAKPHNLRKKGSKADGNTRLYRHMDKYKSA